MFLGPFSPKYGPILLKFWPDVISDKTKQKHFMNNLPKFCLSRNRTYPKFTVLVHFWLGQIYPLKMKRENIAKSQTFKKKNIFRNIKYQNIKSQVPEFHANYVSLFFVTKHLKIFSRSIIEQNEDIQFQNFPMADKKFNKFFLFFWKLLGRCSANYASFFGAMTPQ